MGCLGIKIKEREEQNQIQIQKNKIAGKEGINIETWNVQGLGDSGLKTVIGSMIWGN